MSRELGNLMYMMEPTEVVPVFAGAAAEAARLAQTHQATYLIKFATHGQKLGMRECSVGMWAPDADVPQAAHFVLSANDYGTDIVSFTSCDGDGARQARAEVLPGEPPALTVAKYLMRAVATNASALPGRPPAWRAYDKTSGLRPDEDLLIGSAGLVPIIGQVVQIFAGAASRCAAEKRPSQSQLKARFHTGGVVSRFEGWPGKGRLFFESHHPDPELRHRTQFDMTFVPAETRPDDEPRCHVRCEISTTYPGQPLKVFRDTLQQRGRMVRVIRTRQILGKRGPERKYVANAPTSGGRTILHMARIAAAAQGLPPDVDVWGS